MNRRVERTTVVQMALMALAIALSPLHWAAQSIEVNDYFVSGWSRDHFLFPAACTLIGCIVVLRVTLIHAHAFRLGMDVLSFVVTFVLLLYSCVRYMYPFDGNASDVRRFWPSRLAIVCVAIALYASSGRLIARILGLRQTMSTTSRTASS